MTGDLLLPLASNEGIFGVPHGILSSPDEWIALAIGLVALAVAILYDGDLDLRPLLPAAVVGIIVSLTLSILAPPIVTEEWHVPLVVLILALGGAYVLHRR